MSARIRAFIAVKIKATPPLRKVLAQLSAMGRAVRAVAADNLHVSLRFLGDTDLAEIPNVARVVEVSAAGVPAFGVRFAGLGAFPNPDRPKVVWAALRDDQPLVRIVERLEPGLARLGFFPETKAFVSHLTLARVKARPPGELGELLVQHAATDFGTAFIDEVELLQSELTPEGPLYTRLAAAELAD